MNFLSWCTVCSNILFIITRFLSSIVIVLFFFICVFDLIKILYRSFKEKKIIFSKILFLVLFFVLVFIGVDVLSNLFMEYIIDIEDTGFWGEGLATYSEKVGFAKSYVNLWLYGIVIFGYLYCKISNYVVKVRKLAKKILYISYGFLVVITASLVLVFFKSYDYLIEHIDDFYECHSDCGGYD